MAMVGYKTESIYRRYAIVDEAMHREAAAKLDAWANEQQAKAKAEPRKGQVRGSRSAGPRVGPGGFGRVLRGAVKVARPTRRCHPR